MPHLGVFLLQRMGCFNPTALCPPISLPYGTRYQHLRVSCTARFVPSIQPNTDGKTHNLFMSKP